MISDISITKKIQGVFSDPENRAVCARLSGFVLVLSVTLLLLEYSSALFVFKFIPRGYILASTGLFGLLWLYSRAQTGTGRSTPERNLWAFSIGPIIWVIIFFLLPDEDIHALFIIGFFLVAQACQLIRKKREGEQREICIRAILFFLLIGLGVNILDLLPDTAITDWVIRFYSVVKYHITILTLILGGFLLYFLKRQPLGGREEEKKEKIAPVTITKTHVVLILLISAIYLFFGFQNWKFISLGEVRWTNLREEKITLVRGYDDISRDLIKNTSARCEAYWTGYAQGDLKATFNNTNPNATLCFLHLPNFVTRYYTSLEQYIFISRATIIMHNLLMLYVIFYLLTHVVSKRQALFGMGLLALQPAFIGYSQVFNHDAIQGLYSISFLLAMWAALKHRSKKHMFIAGIFFSLALLTQIKSQYIVPLLFLFPLLYAYVERDLHPIEFFSKHLSRLYSAAIAVALVLMPAVLFFPRFIVDRFFFYQRVGNIILLVTLGSMVLFCLSIYKPQTILRLFRFLYAIESYLIRLSIIGILALFTYSLWQQQDVFNFTMYQYLVQDLPTALWGGVVVLFYATPPIILLLILFWFITYLKKPVLDLSSFFILLFFAGFTALAASSFTQHVRFGDGYLMVETKYAFTLLPLLIIGLVTHRLSEKISPRAYHIFSFIVFVALIPSTVLAAPFFHDYGNFLLPTGQINSRNSWGVDTGLVAKYVNDNLSQSKIYHPKGTLHPLLKDDIEVIGWSKFFWEQEPDYVVVVWDKSHYFSKILDFYREQREPIWSIRKNGVVYVGIYAFDPSIPYKELFQQTLELNTPLQNYRYLRDYLK